MVGSIREILKIETPDKLRAAFIQLEQDLEEKLCLIEGALERNILSPDVPDIMQHMAYVESWRSRIGRYLYLVDGFVSYAKSSQFALPASKGVTEIVRESYKKSLSGPFEAMQRRLDNLIDGVDSRVNMCKKKVGMETEVAGKRQMAA